MNRGHVLQSLPVQQMIAGSCPNWWNINSDNNMMMMMMMRSPPNDNNHQQSSPNYLAPPATSMSFSHYMLSSSLSSSSSSCSSCHENQDQFPDSWSQLLTRGVVGEEDTPSLNHIQDKKLENWEEQLLLQHHAPNCHGYQAVAMPSWSQTVPLVSSPKSSCITTTTTTTTNISTNMLDFSSNKVDRKRSSLLDHSSEYNSSVTGGAHKKARAQPSSTPSTFKVRKEKLGDRVAALHQLVSPFGKTDTASVLLEAIGYIRFLQNQVEALSMPYLGNVATNMRQQQANGERNCLFPEDFGQESHEEPRKDLRSRGLCLVPISCTLQVGSENGADYWAPAFGGGFI